MTHGHPAQYDADITRLGYPYTRSATALPKDTRKIAVITLEKEMLEWRAKYGDHFPDIQETLLKLEDQINQERDLL
ncbi:hypothetical protein NYP18_08945 [Corynebacterium sp. YIM 101645]|uniref:Transposase n=1 Tax=Corynebacterium lemuris TaxID=1859292 RepID=A0ABT2FX23_9CORY|nr:hypothetical protein [Corynebacterium lemuris]MCS5479785.1 hypothetical protein [Corynebacterium lemuris]